MQVPPSTPQYPAASKHAPGGSPQYRAPFPQLSPQMSSPRPQMSPRPSQPQMSPRPVMSPAKPNASPHPQMQQTTLSPRPASSLTPKSTTASPVSMPPYSQQSTLQALEQMVMPPTSTNNSEYSSYQQRSLGGQNPLSPVMTMRNPMVEQHWPPQQSQQQRSHLSSLNGMGVMDQGQLQPTIPPQSQTLTPTANLQTPTQTISATPSLEPSYANEDLSKNTLLSLPEVPAPMPQPVVSQQTTSVSPLISQSDFSPTSVVDKPSSTTEMNVVASSTHEMITASHSVTPTPSSTTDDNVVSNQEQPHSLPEPVKSLEETSNSQPTQSQHNTNSNSSSSFTDFTNISSMTNYTNAPTPVVPPPTPVVLQPAKSNMDDLMPSSMPGYGNDSSDSIVSSLSVTPTTNSTPQMPPQVKRLFIAYDKMYCLFGASLFCSFFCKDVRITTVQFCVTIRYIIKDVGFYMCLLSNSNKSTVNDRRLENFVPFQV